VNKQTGYLNMEKYKFLILKLLKHAPFFKRFDMATLSKYLAYAKPVSYNSEELIFL